MRRSRRNQGTRVRRLYHSGTEITAVISNGRPSYVKGSPRTDQLIPTHVRIVEDGGQRWMELGFDLDVSAVPLTGSPQTFFDADGYSYLHLEWRRNKTPWELGKYIASPTGNEELIGGKTRFWNRAIHPLDAATATAALLVLESDAETGDSRNVPFTGFRVGGDLLALPNYPYAMPGDAAQLQSDLRAAGYSDATVTATTNMDWRIALPNLSFAAGKSKGARVEFTKYFSHIDENSGFSLGREHLDFAGEVLDPDGRALAPEGFGRVCISPGSRMGNAGPLWTPEFAVEPMITNPFAGYVLWAQTYDPLLQPPVISYPLGKITGGRAVGSTLTRPTYVWADPGFAELSIVGTWYKDGVALDEHGATYVAVADGSYTYREVATNENGVSSVSDNSWPVHIVSQALVDAGMEDPNWLAPYVALADGTEDSMIRFLDDPDEPCYEGVWMKADKNRFHHARGPGAAKKYVWNTDSWVNVFRDSLTAVTVAAEWPWPGNNVPNQNWMAKRGATLITNQHIVSCGHGPIGMGTADFPTRLRWLGTDGETYERTLVGQKYCFRTPSGYTNHDYWGVNVNGVRHHGDVWIGTLDTPLPAAVHVARCIPHEFKRFFQGGNWYDSLFVCQSMENEAWTTADAAAKYRYLPFAAADYTPALYHPNYPSRQRTMCCVRGTKYPAVQYHAWAGDSGMPTFLATGTELLWRGFTGGGGIGPDIYPIIQDGVTITWADLAAAMITAADADALLRAPTFNGGIPTGKAIVEFVL